MLGLAPPLARTSYPADCGTLLTEAASRDQFAGGCQRGREAAIGADAADGGKLAASDNTAGGGNPPGGGGTALGRRRRVAARTRLDFWFDAALLVGYTLAYSYGFTGIAVHEWLGIALGLALLFHLTLHWDWVIRTTRKLFSPRGHDKLIWAVNLLLMLAMVMRVVSGIVISEVALPSMGINPQIGPSWQRLHILTAEITLGLVPVHVALRWRWIVRVARRLWTSRSASRAAKRAA